MNNSNIITEKLKTGTVAVLGFGISNRPLVDFLLKKGCKINVRDAKDVSSLGEDCERLRKAGVNFISGADYLCDIYEDVIFRSPGIRPDAGGISEAVGRGAVLTSEMEYFLSLTPAYVIAVTGSDGKTTTTTLTYKLLEEEYKNTDRKVFVGGNIGAPLLPLLDEMSEKDFAVIELSSFQLQTMQNANIRRAAITNITPNHLNWHTDMEEYSLAKANIFSSDTVESLTVNAFDDRTRAYGMAFDGNVTFFSYKDIPEECLKKRGTDVIKNISGAICRVSEGKTEKILDTSEIKLPGAHNIENYMSAISLTNGFVSQKTISKIARTFGGVEHRLEFVREFKGVKYYNSSIDSSPTRTAAALSALKEKPIVICGGYDKNIPFEPLADVLLSRAKAVILTGAARDKILSAISSNNNYSDLKLPVFVEADFLNAVNKARAVAGDGDTVLLSPACASFDAFPNFEVRGNTFKQIVNGFQE